MIRPSSLPILSLCPCFKGKPSSDTAGGTLRHEALAALLRENDTLPLMDLPKDEQEAIEWAVEQIKVLCPTLEHPLEIEQTREWIRPDFSTVSGTPDVVCGPVICDLKTREHDYSAQMADYALERIQAGHKLVTVHLLHTATRRKVTLTFDTKTAGNTVQAALDIAGSGGTPKVNEFCGWCAEAFKCPAHLAFATTVVTGYTSDPRVHSWHPSKMETGEELAYALWIWRTVLSKWGVSVEYHAKEAALKHGKTLACKAAEYEIKTKAGKQYCTDVAQAFTRAGLPQADFLKCCDVRWLTSKKYPEKVGLANVYAGLHGMKLAPAKRKLLSNLEPVIKQAPETIELREKKQTPDDEETE